MSKINRVNKLNKQDIFKIILVDCIVTMLIQLYKGVFVEKIFANTISKNEILQFLKYSCSISLILWMVLSTLILLIFFYNKKILCECLYKYRYFIGFAILVIGVGFEINGSSIGCWSNSISNSNSESGVLLGVSRSIRSDEWATSTPMAFSQYFNDFSYFSNIIRGSETDTFIVYGQPVMNLAILYRPFQIGYLFLSPGKGLSFFWLSRLIALFLVTFELAMIMTKKNKGYSVMTAFFVSFAPIVQWWFAINGLVEMLVFGQLAIILLYNYVRTNDYRKRILYSLILIICAGGYVLTFYPAWQVPLAYVFIALAIWAVASGWKKFEFSLKKDIPIIVVSITILVLSLGIIVYNSIDTIKMVMNTVYPGKRIGCGGEAFYRMWQYIANLFFGITTVGVPINECEMSVFFDLFPIGLILAFIVILKERKRDILLLCLLVADVFLSLYCIFPWPELLAKVTLLSFSNGPRAYAAVGLINIFLLARSLSIIEVKFKKSISIIVALVLACIVVKLSLREFGSYLNNESLILLSLMVLIILFYMVFRSSKLKQYLIIILCFMMLVMGGLVNPIRTGADVIFKNELAMKIQEIAKNDKGLWITEDLGLPMINYPMMVGAPTINSTNVYPNLERWRAIDLDGKNEEIYNRYAHITIRLNKNSDTKFNLITPDSFCVNLNVNDMNALDIKYILSRNDLEAMSNDVVEIIKLEEVNDYKVYKVNYK